MRLLEGPTPLQRLARTEARADYRGLFVKRDDAMPLAWAANAAQPGVLARRGTSPGQDAIRAFDQQARDRGRT